MQQPTPRPRPDGRRRVIFTVVLALAGAVALSAAFAAGYLVRGRLQPDAGEAHATAESGDARTCASGQTGTLRRDTKFTADDGAATVVRYSISLPDDYFTACKQYPVVYALHGKTQNNQVFLDEAMTMRRAMAAGVLDQAIIVTPDSYSTGRWENRDTGPAEDNFIKQLIPHVEATYRVKPGPSHRLLTGFSMGGHGAIRFGLKYPEMFAAVWSVDGAMAGPDNYLPFVQGKSSGDFHIKAVGGQLNGKRVQTLVEALGGRGVEIPYEYQDLEHQFPLFVDQDERAGWPAMRFLQRRLDR